ncbi:MAG: putative alcohol dehydrogenase, partial [Burkholderiales bacterium]|nr:putative alcohol dehydrogenase [Burkholderiales bacterium]
MRAAVIRAHGGPGSIRIETDFPDPRPGPRDVIVQVQATSINFHDILTRNGLPGIKIPMPCIMGLDFAGEIAEVGAEVIDWRVGQRVLVDPVDRVNYGGLIGEMWHGGLAEFCSVPEAHLVAIPDGVTFRQAAALPVAYGTARRMLITNGGLAQGERVLILGASGGVGTACVLLAKMKGAEVTVCASSSEKLERLQALGADNLINYGDQDFVAEIHRLYGKPHRRKYTNGVDMVVNFTGGDSWVPSLKVLHRGGRIATCGATAGFNPQEDLRYIWSYELKILGSNGW